MKLGEMLAFISEEQGVDVIGQGNEVISSDSCTLQAVLREEILECKVIGIEAADDRVKVWIEVSE